jgi:1-acyl-sn-glycerol-3-phosphate acyltransferase
MEKLMSDFDVCYKDYVDSASKADRYFGFDIDSVRKMEPLLKFLYCKWWRVETWKLDRLKKSGPALLVGNSAGLIPWPAFMLMYALMLNKEAPRRLNIVADLDWIKDERLYSFLVQLGFVPWSSENLKRLFSKGELVAIFPEGLSASAKPFQDRYRMLDFDWTRLLPAVEMGVPIYPVATIGCEESIPTIANLEWLAKFLSMPAFPITPFFPWFPFPVNLGSLPVKWNVKVLEGCSYPQGTDRDNIEETAKKQSRFVEGEIQAELNRLLRARVRAI